MKNLSKNLMVTSILILFICGLSCGVIDKGGDNDIKPEETYKIVVIDSCEYIVISRRPWGGDIAIAHKGNCKFCAERAKAKEAR